MQLKRMKKNKGITLIALVVTILILIILAVVGINVALNENGIIRQAEKTKEFQANGEARENEALDIYDKYILISNWDKNKVAVVTSIDNVIVPVPKGYTASTIPKEKSVATGFVIKEGTNGSATEGINEFVWVPVIKYKRLI